MASSSGALTLSRSNDQPAASSAQITRASAVRSLGGSGGGSASTSRARTSPSPCPRWNQ